VAHRFPSRFVWVTAVVCIVANGVGCSHDARPSGFGTSPDSDASDTGDAGDLVPLPVMSCEPECPPVIPCSSGIPAGVPGGGCPVGLVSEQECCDTCAESTGVKGSVAVDDAGRCSEGAVPEGPCCAVCSNIGPGAVAIGDAGACPGDLVRVGLGCCAPCSDLLGGAVALGADSGTCPAGFGRIGVRWGGAVHEVQCCLQQPPGSADSPLDAGVFDADAGGG
jgi:hypothetical protein